jgi:two-component system sensor histidine kinase TctE
VPLIAVLPLRAFVQYRQTVDQTNEAFDEGLGDTVLALSNLITTRDGVIHLALTSDTERSLRTDQTDTVYIALLDADRRVLQGDQALGHLGVNPVALPDDPSKGLRFYESTINGRRVRVAVKPVACGERSCQIRVAETTIKREHIEREALRDTSGFFALLVLIELMLIWVAVSITFKPLDRVSAELAQRHPNDLHPLKAEHVPSELRPLIGAINDLFDRVQAARQAQQAFLADAAHQLRTPLTALRTEAELALLESGRDSAQPALERIHRSAERAARLASQLLAQARSDAAQQKAERNEGFDLRAIAEQAATDWVPQALKARVDLGFQLEPAPVQGHPYLIREALSNLLHNAIEYTRPAAGAEARVTVRTRAEGTRSVLEVEDNGPGIPPAEREQVLQRFQRGTNAPGTGSGLGLAIVRDIVQSHGGTLELLNGTAAENHAGLADHTGAGEPLPGLLVRISLPRA